MNRKALERGGVANHNKTVDWVECVWNQTPVGSDRWHVLFSKLKRYFIQIKYNIVGKIDFISHGIREKERLLITCLIYT